MRSGFWDRLQASCDAGFSSKTVRDTVRVRVTGSGWQESNRRSRHMGIDRHTTCPWHGLAATFFLGIYLQSRRPEGSASEATELLAQPTVEQSQSRRRS